MPDLGIVTFHSSHNEGAVLQALALSTHLSNVLPGWRVEVVDVYHREKQQWYDGLRNARTHAIEDFARARLPLSSQSHELNGDAPAQMPKIASRYQALVYGSDEVWKLHYSPHLFGLWNRQASPLYPAFPNAYWPYDVQGIQQFAYAVSVGDTIVAKIPEKHRAQMRAMLHRLSLIGVRDRQTRAFVEALDPALLASTERVPDPTFSVPLVSERERQEARRRFAEWGVDFDRPAAAVLSRSPETVSGALRFWTERGYQTVALSLPNAEADIDLSAKPLDPLLWMAGLGLFSVCLSERMHACISCLLGGTPVVALDYVADDKHTDSKLKGLFTDLDLGDFYHPVKLGQSDQVLKASQRIADGVWPWEKVQAGVDRFRQQSLDFGRRVNKMLNGKSDAMRA